MEANATEVVRAARRRIRSLLRLSDLSVRLRLIACFILIVFFIIAADAVAVWQYWQIEALAQRVSMTDQISDAVVRIHLDVYSFRDRMAALAGSHDLRQFSDEAAAIRRSFLERVDHAEQMLRATPDIEQDARISDALESLRVLLLSQLDAALQLANAGEWEAVQLRAAIEIPDLIKFSSSVVERVDQQAQQQRSRVIEDARKARQRLFIIVPISALLTLLMAVALGWYVTQSVTGPLSVLTAGAEGLARGDFQYKVHLDGNNELAILGNAFNYAAQQLQKLYEDLRRSERELRDVINTVPVHVWSASPAGTVDFINERLLNFVGLRPDEMLGWNWESILHPEDQDKFVTEWRAAMKDRHFMESDVRVRRADGEYCWLFIRNVPLRDEAGNIAKWYGSGIDITDLRRAAEERERLRQLQVELAHINRVTTMGELAASIAHEIKQPIAAAITNAQACMQWLSRDQLDLVEVREAARETVKEARRAAEIVNRVRSLFKKEEITRELLDLNEVIAETASLVREEARLRAIPVRTELDAELPRISADRVQLQQVLMNLTLNGLDAMEGSAGTLVIRSQRDEEGRPLISVSDAGIGLPVVEVDKIFDPFFTTKPQGTGMGLAISRSIVESHGGRLWATTNPGPGATFYFTLPNQEEYGA
jgi:PAS domain S-box-containing protein